jgi:hypothetical protein
MKIYCKRRYFRLLNLVLPVEKVMLSIANLMVDGGCIATTGGRRLFYFNADLLPPVVAMYACIVLGLCEHDIHIACDVESRRCWL